MYVSRKRLGDTLNQLMVSDEEGGDVLIRIHTAIHTPEEAVALAAFIKGIIPNAHILGTSTSAIIREGKLIHDQCVISITQMDEGNVRAARIPLKGAGSGSAVPARELCAGAAELIVRSDTKLLFVFSPEPYRDIERFVECSNVLMPGVQMLGGVVDWNNVIGDTGFVFDENGWSGDEMILAALGGDALECAADFVTGVQVVGDLHEITKVRGDHITEIDGKPAAEFIHEGIGEKICTKTDIGFFFPLAYCFDGIDVPFVYGYYGDDGIGANHYVTVGRKLRRCFFYDRKIISRNRSMFDRMESFEKGESLFSYACKDRFRFYPNSVIWELSAYENSNVSGCLTQGEISAAGGRNVYTNCAFVLAAAGENPETQQMNPDVLSHTQSLAEDNQKLIGILTEAAFDSSTGDDAAMKESMRSFVNSCREMLLYTEKESIANGAALNVDIRLRGYDRICMIDVPDQRSIRAAFSEQAIEKTYSHFVSECVSFAAQKNYRIYSLQRWQMAIAVPSYLVSLEDFTKDMKELLRLLAEANSDYIPVIPVFCVIDECAADTLRSVYDAARLEMIQKNIQFYVCNGKEEEPDEESILEKYRMVNVINDALAHDGVMQYYQGIYDNRENTIHHYEALMRLKDENGKVYSPHDFLDVARSYGLLYDGLSMAMIRKVFDAFKDSEDKSVSINLGIRDIRNEELTRYIYSFLSTTRHPEHFIFEVLENEDVDEYKELIRFVDNIHKLGGKISIDDFGSGYSNLQHVINIPVDFLKIDGSIVKECSENKASEGLVKLISTWNEISGTDARIVAEFVENEAIQGKLLEHGIDYSQGYLFSKPAPWVSDHGEEQTPETGNNR
uniref:Diguanylate cyclase/phosphodiesterase n=1 Tax=uncultured bacterium Contigcl_23 TaxID=1393667 RepID=W0FL22_9BACT|nr:diguanylate cyclase/phosphodiesterase [uncultured bacterium Contigcl_23]